MFLRDDLLIFERWNSNLQKQMLSTYVPVAQLDRASACGAEGRTFESYRAYHILNQKSPIWAFFVAIARPLVARGTKKTPIWTILSSKYFKEKKYQSRRFFLWNIFFGMSSLFRLVLVHFLPNYFSTIFLYLLSKILSQKLLYRKKTLLYSNLIYLLRLNY